MSLKGTTQNFHERESFHISTDTQMRHTIHIDKSTSKPSTTLLTASKEGLINLILKIYAVVQNSFFKSLTGEDWNDELEQVFKCYKGDFQRSFLETQYYQK